jgi:general secretion pathway protein N
LIQRWRGLLLVAALTAIIALVVTFPARIAYQWVSSPLLAMSGISGSVWSGKVREFSTYGIYLRDLEWRIQPLRLFMGDIAYAISGSPVSGFFESKIAIGLDGTMTLTDLSAALPLQMMERAAKVPGLRGKASMQFERVQLIHGRASAMEGTLTIADLVVPIVHRGSLGGYKAEFFTQNNGIVASVEDTDGVVDLAGSLQIMPDASYSFLGQVIAKPNTPDAVRRQMRFLGPANERGQQEIRLEGVY